MIKDITVGQYYPADSVIHKLDARTKILGVFGFILSIFLVKNFWGYLVILGFISFTLKLSTIPVRLILRGLKPLRFIIILTFILNIFMTKGTPLFELGPISIHREGIVQALFMVFRLIFLITGTSLLTLTTSPIALTDGIEQLLKPFSKIGLPAHELAMMMTIALRFIPTLLEETDKIMKAQKARGADFESGNILQRAKSLIPILVPLFISAFRRADELAMAMEARCYRGGENRSKMKLSIFTKKDHISWAILVIVILLVFATRPL
jgi:energy-coupling factor transport system permease protein